MQQTLFERQTEAEPPSSGVQVDPIVSKPLLLHGDCRRFLFDGTIEPGSIDLTVTSPPYDNLRTYNNSSSWGWAEFSAVAAGLWLVTKDADLNASMNISLDLQPIRKEERLKCANKAGFYWLVSGQEHIVPDTLKTKYQQISL